MAEEKKLEGFAEEAADFQNVTDETEEERREPVSFEITAFGADPSVFDLVRRLGTGRLRAPPFQRAYVWNTREASRFVESLLMGLPVPGIFVFRDVRSNEDLIVDGQQRLLTLKYFSDGVLRGREFRLADVASPWLGKSFKELATEDRSRIEEATIHVTYFKQDHPQTNDRSIYEVFERINTGGLKLSAQEIRTCVSHGAFVKLLEELNKNPDWRDIYGDPSPRLKDIELILRFLALFYERKSYKRPMRRFLDDFLSSHKELPDNDEREFKSRFASAIGYVRAQIGDRAFRPAKALNAAVFDAVMIGLAERLSAGKIKSTAKVSSTYQRLLADSTFQASYERATADEESVKTRIGKAVEAFKSL